MRLRVREYKANSLMDAFRIALEWTEENTREENDECWFRGVRNSDLSLLPGAYWRPGYVEFDALLQFSQEGRAFADIGEIDDWRTYYLAQHSGIPTRLLDWTENLLTALFFATDGWTGETTPCVWIVRPCRINELSLGYFGLISPERNEELGAWTPTRNSKGTETIKTEDKKYLYNSANPIALYPRKNNARLVAQQGTFTVHGTQNVPLDRWILAEEPANHGSVICKIVFSKRLRFSKVSSQLAALGLRRSTIYPDLHNFVLQMKDRHSF